MALEATTAPPGATCEVYGRLAARPRFSDRDGRPFCRADLSSTAGEFVVLARGATAERLTSAGSGTALRVAGKLLLLPFETSADYPRLLAMIEARELELL